MRKMKHRYLSKRLKHQERLAEIHNFKDHYLITFHDGSGRIEDSSPKSDFYEWSYDKPPKLFKVKCFRKMRFFEYKRRELALIEKFPPPGLDIINCRCSINPTSEPK